MKDHIHAFGGVSLERLGHLLLKEGFDIQFIAGIVRICWCIFLRRSNQGKNGGIGVLHFLGSVQGVDGVHVVADGFRCRDVFRVAQLDAFTGVHGRPVEVTHAGVENAACFFTGFAGQMNYHGDHEFGFGFLEKLRRHDILSEPGGCNGRDGVDVDIVFLTFQLDGVHEAHQTHFGCRVVGLAEISVKAGCRGGHDDTAIALVLHYLHCRPGHMVRAVEMDR